MKKSPLRRKKRRAKKPPERVTCRAGLLWRNGAPIPQPEADTVARAHGYGCAEEMVRGLRDGTESVLCPVRKARQPLPQVSRKLAAKLPEYNRAVKEWWAGHDHQCEMRRYYIQGPAIGIPLERVKNDMNDGYYYPGTRDGTNGRCQRSANPRPHHSKKRGKFLCDKSTFLGLCDSCHLIWLHNNEEEARRVGYLTDRPAKELKLKRLNPHPGKFQANEDLPGSF